MQEEQELELENIESEQKDQETDVAQYKIVSYGADMTLENLSQNFERGDIKIPEFQRNFVWSLAQASKLIESFLLGLPVPQIFVYREKATERLLVVDGQQRLRSINNFFKGTFDEKPFRLTNVHEKWEGKTFEDLAESDKKKIRMSVLRALIFEQTDPEDNSSIFEIFERLNTGGTKLSFQEVRNCIVRGEITSFLANLNNNNKTWRKILNKEKPDKRMRDIEMIIRFFALYEKRNEYKKPMKEFLTKFMREKKNLNLEEKENYKNLFEKTIEKINSDIGSKEAFRLSRNRIKYCSI